MTRVSVMEQKDLITKEHQVPALNTWAYVPGYLNSRYDSIDKWYMLQLMSCVYPFSIHILSGALGNGARLVGDEVWKMPTLEMQMLN